MSRNLDLLRIALRYRAIYLDVSHGSVDMTLVPDAPVMAFVARLAENGFTVSEELLHALCSVPATTLASITEVVNDVMGVNLNWAPLVKGWDTPTGETLADHIVTFLANALSPDVPFKGVRLPCGHLIPEGTFPIERYNGCPYCGKPFQTANYVHKGQGSRLKELRLFTEDDIRRAYLALLKSPVPLDATQTESLKTLLAIYPLPDDVAVTMKETSMLVVDTLVELNRAEEAAKPLAKPSDVLRYVWYKKTNQLRVMEPRTLIKHAFDLNWSVWKVLDRSGTAAQTMRNNLKLKYSRADCRHVAQWLNATSLSAEAAAEDMNPKRGMWVRLIHALRLGEYSRKKGYEHLANILDVFYHRNYTTWSGQLEAAIARGHKAEAISLLKQRPGEFARHLFSSMLKLGPRQVLEAFASVAHKLPARLLLSLANNADSCFDPETKRMAKPITGAVKKLESNKLLSLYRRSEREAMAREVNEIFRQSMHERFSRRHPEAPALYIDPGLFNIPLAVGDRGTTVQDVSAALQGTRFPVEGDSVRLFLQWGKGLHAQDLDMDLSCYAAYENGETKVCAYDNLVFPGAKHSGDIQSIPEMTGTAEYIELSLPQLEADGAKYVIFTCNAYTPGALVMNLVVGWMNSAYPMEVSEANGVAYDPSTVQHQVRVGESNLSKGLVFGVLLLPEREIVWLEMPFTAQTIRSLDAETVTVLLQRLANKISIGQLLQLKAEAQGMAVVATPEEAPENQRYTVQWALDTAQVSALMDV